jgi:hypothetical protein
MTSQKQLESNRANARRSTGPQTPRGKARSSSNALKHGLMAAKIVIGDENPQEFEALRANFERDFQSETDFERELVERIASYTWRLRRIPVFEAAYMQFFERQARDDDPFSNIDVDDDDDGNAERPTVAKMASWLSRNDDFHNALAKLSRYEAFLLNAFNRTLQQLLFLRSQRQADNQLPPPNLIEGSTSDESASS